jgi:hypothetical protein
MPATVVRPAGCSLHSSAWCANKRTQRAGAPRRGARGAPRVSGVPDAGAGGALVQQHSSRRRLCARQPAASRGKQDARAPRARTRHRRDESEHKGVRGLREQQSAHSSAARV